jgi:uncharacterized protein YqfA (UPF0365 family)
MEYLVFISKKSGNRVVLPASGALIVERKGSVVVYAIGGSGKERMVWELPDRKSITVHASMAAALAG